MAFTPEDSAIRLTADDEAKIATMDGEQIKLFMREVALRDHLISLDPYSGDPIPTPLADNAPKRFAKTISVKIDGVPHKEIVEADSPEALLRAENDYLARLLAEPASQSSEPMRSEQPREAATGRFASPTPDDDADAADIAARAEIELRFKRGEISTDQYLAESGAIERHLQSIGVDIPELQQRGWENATEEFRARHPEWQGGEAAKSAMANAVISLGLDSEPSVATLEKAYNHLLSTNSLPANPELQREQEYLKALDAATDPRQVHEITAKYYGGRGSSSIFGGR